MVTKISKKVNTAPTKGKAKPISKARDSKDMKKYQDKQKRRQERKDKAKKAQKNNQNSRRDNPEDDKSDEENFDDIDGSDYDDEMAQVQEDLDADKNLDETIFDQFQSGELDLPSEGESEDHSADDIEMSDGEDADDLDDYYRELGIDPDEMKPQVQQKQKSKPKGDAVYVTKEKKETSEQVKQRQRSELLERMMQRARDQPNYKILNRIIQVVKSVFTDKSSDDDGADDTGKKDASGKPKVNDQGPKKSAVQLFSQALNSDEYLKLLRFFTGELPMLCLQCSGVEKFVKKTDIQKAYKSVTGKMQILLKSYGANYTRLVGEALSEHNLTYIEHFFVNGVDIVRCILPNKTYAKKLGMICARISATYSRIDKNGIVLAFNALKHLITWSKIPSLFETVMKKMYNEFTRESKIGGGGMAVQERLRIC